MFNDVNAEIDATAFLMANGALSGNLVSYLTTIDNIESLTDLDFLNKLPDDIEERIESGKAKNVSFWMTAAKKPPSSKTHVGSSPKKEDRYWRLNMEKWMLLIALTGSLGAAVAAIAASVSAKETKKTVLAQILAQIVDSYGSSEMLSGMLSLRNWQEQNGPDFAKKFGLLRRVNYFAVKAIDEDRRRYSHHFHKIRILLNSGVVSKTFVRKVVSSDQVAVLLEVVEPLEKESPYYKSLTFDTFRKIYHKDDICGRKS